MRCSRGSPWRRWWIPLPRPGQASARRRGRRRRLICGRPAAAVQERETKKSIKNHICQKNAVVWLNSRLQASFPGWGSGFG